MLFTSWDVQVVALANQFFVNQTITDFINQQDLFQIHSRQGSDVFTAINNAGREESPFQTQLSSQWKRFGFFKSTKIIFYLGMGTQEHKVSQILLVANEIISTNVKVPSPEELRKHGASPIVTR